MSQDAKKDEFRKYLEKAGRWFKTLIAHTAFTFSSLKCFTRLFRNHLNYQEFWNFSPSLWFSSMRYEMPLLSEP